MLYDMKRLAKMPVMFFSIRHRIAELQMGPHSSPDLDILTTVSSVVEPDTNCGKQSIRASVAGTDLL